MDMEIIQYPTCPCDRRFHDDVNVSWYRPISIVGCLSACYSSVPFFMVGRSITYHNM